MSDIRIVKGLPVPKEYKWTPPTPDANRPGRKAIYPFGDMEVGDCLVAPRDRGHNTDGSCIRSKALRASASAWKARNGLPWRFLIRSIDKDTVGCWRIA